MPKQIEDLKAEIAAKETVKDATITLLYGIATQVEAANSANNAPPSPAVASMVKMIRDDAENFGAAVAAKSSGAQPVAVEPVSEPAAIVPAPDPVPAHTVS